MEGTNWVCSFCGHHQTIIDQKLHTEVNELHVGKNCYGNTAYRVTAIGCSNPECGQIDLHFSFGTKGYGAISHELEIKNIVASRRILPESSAKPQPKYIPDVICNDYLQACRIKDLSPKASATMSRRCLQGMIRDFCGISKNRLIDEILALREQVDSGTAASGVTVESVDAIDHVRSIGNIGAHMEKNIDLVIDVEPEEAQALIELIELLFEEWYVARKTRQDRLASVRKIAASKEIAKTAIPVTDGENDSEDSGEVGTEAA